jgi:hypothetical protein
MLVTVAHLRRGACRVHNVGEQDGGEHPIVGHLCSVAGEELSDFPEGIAPRFNEVENIAPGQVRSVIIGMR